MILFQWFRNKNVSLNDDETDASSFDPLNCYPLSTMNSPRHCYSRRSLLNLFAQLDKPFANRMYFGCTSKSQPSGHFYLNYQKIKRNVFINLRTTFLLERLKKIESLNSYQLLEQRPMRTVLVKPIASVHRFFHILASLDWPSLFECMSVEGVQRTNPTLQ